jgi:hypothetical protein
MGYWGVDRFENSDRHDKRNLSFVFWVSLPDEPGATADEASTALRLPALVKHHQNHCILTPIIS